MGDRSQLVIQESDVADYDHIIRNKFYSKPQVNLGNVEMIQNS